MPKYDKAQAETMIKKIKYSISQGKGSPTFRANLKRWQYILKQINANGGNDTMIPSSAINKAGN
jgi:hypothetical protein